MSKGWNSEWLTSCPMWNCTIAQSLKPVLPSHSPCFLPVNSAIVKGFLTSLPWKSYFPLGVTHPWPSITGHNNAGNIQGQPWQPICRAFHGLHCPIWASLTMTSGADEVSHSWGQSAFVRRPSYDILRVKSHSGHWHFSFRSLLLHVWI